MSKRLYSNFFILILVFQFNRTIFVYKYFATEEHRLHSLPFNLINMRKILVTHQLPKEAFVNITDNYEIIIPDNGMITNDMTSRYIGICDALLPTYAFKVTKEIIDCAANLKIIANFGAGYDNIDVNYVKKKGILVTNSPAPVVEPTAELAFALLLNVARRVSECDRNLRSKKGLKIDVMKNLGIGVYGKILGIVGLGAIGQATARRARACGMQIVYHNRKRLPREIEDEYMARWVTLNELMAISDFISLHVPANPVTYHMIDSPQLDMMKPTAVLINTARGSLINEQALIETLRKKTIFGAALDVFENEPYISPELLQLDNVVLSPHNGTGTIDARIECTRYALRNIINYFEGRQVLSPVNL